MTYPGGKGGAGTYQKLINLMPPHTAYYEPFLGNASVMRRKRPALVNVGIDLDPAAPGLAWLAAIGKSSEERRRLSPNPAFGDGARFRSKIGDGISFLEQRTVGFSSTATVPRFTDDSLVYCDPPYLMETRGGRRLYQHEMSDVDHRRLLRCCSKLPCRVMISGYWSKLYASVLAKWNTIHFESMTRGGHTATEWVWFNFDPPLELHDYRYLGATFRDRERIRRKQARWTNRLQKMDAMERQALLLAIAATEGKS